MASVAVLMFSIVAVVILIANFNLNYAVNTSADAFDTFNSEMVEKNGLAQIVKESLLAVGETATTDSANSLQTEIQNRLGSMNFPAGVSVTLAAPVPGVPSNPSFPSGTYPSGSQLPAAVALPSYFSGGQPGIAGLGGLFTSLAIQGPVANIGALTFTFNRVSAASAMSAEREGAGPGDNQTYVVSASLYSVPLTNVDIIGYGLPASGTIPTAAPPVPPGFFGSNASALVVTSNNPANDPTAYPDLFNPSSTETLPYQFRNAVSFSWNAYEYLWSAAYQNALLATAAQPDPGNGASPAPVGATYDFSAANNPTIDGVSAVGNTVTIDCGAVESPVIAVVDSEGVGTVNIQGSASPGAPFVLLVRNTAGGLGATQVNFSGSNNRPAIFYMENSSVAFSGSPQIQGALFLDPTSQASGSVTWFGHFSFYAPASPLGSLNMSVNDSPAVKAALAPIAPRVLLVSASATR
jgi:hypothetical protein